MDKISQSRILYVEDDDFIREELIETLEFDVKELYVAKNGVEGLKKFKKYNPDLVISDIKMPKMNGLDMAKEIKKISYNTPIIITTAFSDSDYLIKAIDIGIDKYVAKPVDIDKLYSAIEELTTILFYKKEKETQNRYLKYILDFSPIFILIINHEKIEYINKSFLNFLGFKSFSEFVKRNIKIENLIETIKDVKGNRFKNVNYIKKIIDNFNTQYIIYFKNDKNRPFIVLQNYFEELEKNIIIFSDITNLELNRVSLNEEILKLREDNEEKIKLLKIQSKQALMGEMISAIAHQWKQPLNALSLNFQIIDIDDLDKEEISFCVENGLKQVSYMSKTIEDFRNFFSPTKKMSSFSIKKVIDDVVNLFEKQLSVHNIELKLEVDELSIFGYENDLSQVLMNLIKNSKDEFDKLNKGNKYIKLITYSKVNNIYIEVEDNAGGIRKEILDKIFQPYFTTKDKGTGIGLYICKMLIDNMQGDMYVKSENEKTIFTLKLLRG